MEEKNKKSVVLILIFVIVVLLIAIGILLFNLINKKDESNNSVDLQENLNKENEEIKGEKEEKEEEKLPDYSAKIQEVYNKIGEKNFFAKNINLSPTLYTVNNGEIVYNNGNIKNVKIHFTYGVPKYVYNFIGGGMLVKLFVATENGEVYQITPPKDKMDLIILDENYDTTNLQISKIEINEKVIDITFGNSSTVPYSGPYFLTEKGNLITQDGKTYDEINRNHIKCLGSKGLMVYVNADNTFETIRNYNTYEYIQIIDESGNKVKGKYAFYAYSSSKEYIYIVDENNRLLRATNDNLMVAYSYLNSKVKNIKYNNNKVEILLENNETHTIDQASPYLELF